jgi:hypothetical protein
MSDEVFDRRGRQVQCEFPCDDHALLETVHGHWFDVLKLSQSGSLRRNSRLLPMRDTIGAARVASLNPGLIVMADGRAFAERPPIHRAVHANAVSKSILEALPIAERMLQGQPEPHTHVEVSAS